jgi:hypothetical protein
MLALAGLSLLLIECPYALLQCQKTLVNLSALLLSLFIVALAILGSLTPGKIDQK